MEVTAYSAIPYHYPAVRSDQALTNTVPDPESEGPLIVDAEDNCFLVSINEESVRQNAEELNQFLASRRIRLRFTLLLSEGAVLVQVQDTSTGEVIREMTISAFLRALQSAGPAQGFFLNETA